MSSISNARFLSENYSILHGLKAVPIGLCLLVISFWVNLYHYPDKDFSLPIAVVCGSLLLFIAIHQYYIRTFGEVKPISASHRIYWVGQFIAGTLALAAFWVDVNFDLPVNFVGLIFASVFLLDKPKVSLPLNKFCAIKLILSVCMIFVSIIPLEFWHAFGVRESIVGVTMLAGILIVIQGVIWHIFFVKSLPIAEAANE